MASATGGMDVDGIISPEESVSGMLRVIETKDMRHTATFWTWEGKNVPRNYGPELTHEQVARQNTKYYPNMMPPKGTFLHWFLTNTWIHLWITLGTLTLLASFTMWENWKRSTTFKNGLPTRGQVLLHPLDSFYQFIFAWRASADEQSMPSYTKNQRGVDDVQKRASYRKAHGGDPDDQGVEYWPPFEKKYGHCVIDERSGRLVDASTLPNNGVRPQPKKWFGIW
ncbi:uncharacterized protein KY384_004467 [Bacidia gigantensis]|uniref:uncharacterized protein n=1 Tax=Bacidia gigantensis TaxID=2732470 RepID=UPI001D0383B1|nr:uncharacterized protein KY384_004467 [Bacidia gigantensis]KAG8531110.1 hypothetical protein KY384_004467 [Bacidia gigantensis]